jgi:hypothetical protein
MSKIRAFSVNAPTLLITAGTTASTPVALPNVGASVRLCNTGANIVYVHLAPAPVPVVATLPGASFSNTCLPVLPGEDAIFFKGNATDWNISAITSTGTSGLLVSVGEGI